PSRACSATRSGPCAAPTPMWSGCRWPRWWPICGGWVRCRASRMSSGADIAAPLAQVRARIERAARRAGRQPAGVRLVAVSKTRPREDVRAALWAGQRVFGENYAQELRDKARALGGASPAPEWHFIGPLQKNKVKYVVGTAVLVHAIESAELAAEIDRRGAAGGRARGGVRGGAQEGWARGGDPGRRAAKAWGGPRGGGRARGRAASARARALPGAHDHGAACGAGRGFAAAFSSAAHTGRAARPRRAVDGN